MIRRKIEKGEVVTSTSLELFKPKAVADRIPPQGETCTELFLKFSSNSNSVSKNKSNPFKIYFFLKSHKLYIYTTVSQYQRPYNGIYETFSSDDYCHNPATQLLLSLSRF